MRQVIELYDQQIGIAGRTPQSTFRPSSQVDQPTVGDIAELLGITPLEAQQLLNRAREQQRAKVAAIRAQTAPSISNLAPQQVTVVQNVIMDSHAPLFQKFDANRGNFVPTWNWGAFLFLWLWYFYKGMWTKGLLYLFFSIVLGGVTGGAGLGFLPFILGMLGNYDYYLFRCHDTQVWKKRRSMTAIVNPYNRAEPPTIAAPSVTNRPPAPATTENLEQMAQKLQLLREAFDRKLITADEFEEKRYVLLNEVENQSNLKTLAEAHRLGLLSDEEYRQKRAALLRR